MPECPMSHMWLHTSDWRANLSLELFCCLLTLVITVYLLCSQLKMRTCNICAGSLAASVGAVMQAYQQQLDEINVKLTAIADYGDELRQLKTKHEMTANHNAAAFIKLQVRHAACSSNKSSACLPVCLSACQSVYSRIWPPIILGVCPSCGYSCARLQVCMVQTVFCDTYVCLLVAPVQSVGGVSCWTF